MTVRDLVRPVPGVQRLSLLRQRIGFRGSAQYWERNYACGGTSGPGSYGALAEGKAAFLNAFVDEHGVGSVIEFGCGDGHQLSLARYPRYVGVDVSRTAIGLCRRQFAHDGTKSFFLYDDACFVDRAGLFTAELALSLDVIYHLTEDEVFEPVAALRESSEAAPIIDLVDLVVRSAIKSKASDIHVEPMEKGVLIRHRLDGLLKEVMDLPKWVHEGLIARLRLPIASLVN